MLPRMKGQFSASRLAITPAKIINTHKEKNKAQLCQFIFHRVAEEKKQTHANSEPAFAALFSICVDSKMNGE